MTKERNFERELSQYRSFQQEMTALARQESEARQAEWSRELQAMAAAWRSFEQDWQGTLEQMGASALAAFEEISARGLAAGSTLVQGWRQALHELGAEMEAWAGQAAASLEQVGGGLMPSRGGGLGGDLLSWVGLGLGFAGIFHEGGIPEAHNGLVVSPESLLSEERLVRVQTGEGILPRETMVRLGEENFEALRTGRFKVGPAGPPPLNITIQVQALDASQAAGMDWDKVVKRHLLPALERELARRW